MILYHFLTGLYIFHLHRSYHWCLFLPKYNICLFFENNQNLYFGMILHFSYHFASMYLSISQIMIYRCHDTYPSYCGEGIQQWSLPIHITGSNNLLVRYTFTACFLILDDLLYFASIIIFINQIKIVLLVFPLLLSVWILEVLLFSSILGSVITIAWKTVNQ